MIATIGRVKFPILAIVKAVPKALKAARAEHEQNRGETTPGGTSVTPGEVGEEILAFVSALAEEIAPAMMRVNGISAS